MQATFKAKVTAVTFAKDSGVIEGKEISWDFTKVHVELVLRGVNARGKVTQAYKIGDSIAYRAFKFESISLPFFAELDIEKTSNGKGDDSEEIIGFRIIDATPPASANSPIHQAKAA